MPRLARFELLSNVIAGICRKRIIRREYILLQDPFHLLLKIVDIVSCRVFHYLIR